MQSITPFLWFDGKAEEAAKFYTSIFKNSKITSSNPMSASFVLDGQEFMALNGGPMFTFTPAISFFIRRETQDEIDEMWEKLTANGGEPGRCGWLKDQFGVSWQVIPSVLGKMISDKDPQKAKRAIDAMMKMDKIVIRELEEAYNQ